MRVRLVSEGVCVDTLVMKRLLLLPVLLLAACAPVAGVGGPFKVGDRFSVMGEDRNGVSSREVITIRQPGQQPEGRYWEYAASVRVADRAWVRTSRDGELFLAVSEIGNEVRLCVTAPSGPGWKVSHGALVTESSSGYERLVERLEDSNATLRELASQHGVCIVQRE